MKKLLVAAGVLALAAVSVAGVMHVKSSFEQGVCPLTGRPIHRAVSRQVECPPTPDCPYTDARCTEQGGAAQECSTQAEENVCPTQRHCCGQKKAQCCDKQSAPADEKP